MNRVFMASIIFMLSFTAAFGSLQNGNTIAYEIFVRSFYDSNGDGIGDFNGIIQKLDYLNDGDPKTSSDLGINMIWLMPMMKSPSYHGYDVSDYYNVNSEYGTMADFENLIKEAHKRGIKVIIDMVINHTASDNQWFIKSSSGDTNYKDWYVWRDEKSDGWTGFGQGGPWYQKNGEYYYAIFDPAMPDLNYKTPAVLEEIKKVSKFWIDRGVDGFRFDAARYIVETGPGLDGGQGDSLKTIKFWKTYLDYLREIKPDIFTVGEIFASLSSMEMYYLYGNGFDAVFDFDFGNALTRTLNNESRKYLNLYLSQKRNPPASYFSPFWRNHDMDRYMASINNSLDRAKLGFAVMLTLPGAPFIYYGEEIGMANSERWNQRPNDSDPSKRSPMQWDSTTSGGFTKGKPWMNSGINIDPFNVSSQEKDTNSLLNSIKEFIKIRNNFPALSSDTVQVVSSGNTGVESYFRKGDKDGVLVLINLTASKQSANLKLYGTSAAENTSFSNITKPETLQKLTKDNYGKFPVSLEPYEVKFLYTPFVLDAPSQVPSGEGVLYNNIKLLIDDSVNSLDKIFMYGTISGISNGVFKENTYGDVVEKGYALTEDGNKMWSLNLNLTVDYEDPYIIKFGVEPQSAGIYIGGFKLFVTNDTPFTYSYKIPARALAQDVNVIFTVDMAGVPGITRLGIRGSFTGDGWNSHVPIYDDGTHGDKKAGDNIYTGTVLIKKGANAYFEYKYNKDGSSSWESRPNRSFIIDSSKDVNEIGPDVWDMK